MRYITQHSDLILQRNDGKIGYDSTTGVEYRFGIQGILNVGSLTTNIGTGNAIDASLKTDDTESLQLIYPTDLLGATTHRIEMAGQGSLTSSDCDGTALPSLQTGYRGFIFEAPVMTGTDTVVGVADIYYRVLSGTVTYRGVVYSAGDEFVTAGGTTATTGSGTFALTIPPYLDGQCEKFRTEQFEINALKTGDEPSDFWKFSIGGATPRDSLTCTDADYFGWIR
jgi:hypothetical protein